MRTRDQRLPTVQVTSEAWRGLPLLLSRSVFRAWSGLSDEDLSALVKAGKIGQHKRVDKAKAKYYKRDLATLTGFVV